MKVGNTKRSIYPHSWNNNENSNERGTKKLNARHWEKQRKPWKNSRKIHSIQGDTRTLLGKDCKVERWWSSLRRWDVWGNIEMIGSWQDQQAISSILYSLMTLTLVFKYIIYWLNKYCELEILPFLKGLSFFLSFSK